MNDESRTPSDELGAVLEGVAASVQRDFERTKRILSFDEWFALLRANPRTHARTAAQYVRDALEHFGRRPVSTPSGPVDRFCLFDRTFDDGHRLVGQEAAQNSLFEALEGYCRLGRTDTLLLLHGPNGSAKSTLLECLQRGLEVYSRSDEGALYRFAWVFPTREAGGGGIGFGSAPASDLGDGSFAGLGADALDARVSDETKDHPIYLLPVEQRAELLREIVDEDERFFLGETVRNGELSARNRRIFDALLAAYHGDLHRVFQHVQVERFFLSRTYREGLVDVEPKQAVDARSFPVTGDRAFAALPAAVSGQVLYASQGDLVDANRGLINYTDLLKRPYEHFKYLLTATETARVALEQVVLGLDVVFTGSANDINLLAFRATRAAEYQSFKARLELIPVPYLLDFRVERKVYQEQVGDLLRGVHIAPHVPRLLAMWGVMTRLRRPDPENYDEKIRGVLEKLGPLEKADLYAYGRVPPGLSSDEARELLAAVPRMHKERYDHVAVRAEGSDHLLGDYEGSFGASVRDLKGVLLNVASRPGSTVVTVPALFTELRRFLDDVPNHKWMMLEQDGAGFHLLDGDDKSISNTVWQRWLDLSDREVREALGLVDEQRYVDLFQRYLLHAKHAIKKERLFDEVTGELQDPDEHFMSELEQSMDPSAGERFREDVIARIGAWALSHPNEEPVYEEIFADYFARMREDYFRQQKETVRRGIDYMLDLLAEDEHPSTDDPDLSAVEKERAQRGLAILVREGDPDPQGEWHTEESLKETLVALRKARY